MKRGLTLMEVIVTSSLLGLCALFILSILPGAMLSVRQSEHRLGANALAKAILDECAAGPFSYLEGNGNYQLGSPGPLGDMLARQQYQLDDQTELKPRLEVTHDGTIPNTRLAFLHVIVKWEERNQEFRIDRYLRLSCLER